MKPEDYITREGEVWCPQLSSPAGRSQKRRRRVRVGRGRKTIF